MKKYISILLMVTILLTLFPPSSSHWSRVVRDSDSSSRKGTAGPGGTSRAFINTNFGEVAYFSADLSD